MASSAAKTVKLYLDELPEDRHIEVAKVRKIILINLPKGYEEVMQYGMISYIIPFTIYPITYNNQPLVIASLGSQKNYISLYLMGVYGDSKTNAWFMEEYKKSGKKLNMGKSCLRFKKADDIPLDLIAKVIARIEVHNYIAAVDEARRNRTRK